MIRFSLVCDKAHGFEGWFRNSAEFDRQAKARRLECPVCGSAKVGKAMMAPAVSTSRKKEGKAARPAAKMPVAAPDPRQQAALQVLREMRKAATENADYVGSRFPEEARKIHYKETDARGIYGEATPEEAKKLIEEGVEFYPLPVLPEDQN
jgi:hypothetical protein